jgi:hypothetical protein
MLKLNPKFFKPHPKILAILLCAAVLFSSLGISAQPAVAQIPQDPLGNAEAYYYVIFPHLVVWGSGFPANESFALRVSKDGEPFETLLIFKTKDDGTFVFKDIKLPLEYAGIRKSFLVCFKSREHPTWPLVCAEPYSDFVIIPHNQCTPSRHWGTYIKIYIR